MRPRSTGAGGPAARAAHAARARRLAPACLPARILGRCPSVRQWRRPGNGNAAVPGPPGFLMGAPQSSPGGRELPDSKEHSDPGQGQGKRKDVAASCHHPPPPDASRWKRCSTRPAPRLSLGACHHHVRALVTWHTGVRGCILDTECPACYTITSSSPELGLTPAALRAYSWFWAQTPTDRPPRSSSSPRCVQVSTSMTLLSRFLWGRRPNYTCSQLKGTGRVSLLSRNFFFGFTLFNNMAQFALHKKAPLKLQKLYFGFGLGTTPGDAQG